MRNARPQLGPESGQAMVETAIVMPTLIFTILGTLQLTMMQQASLMLEYAAYNAARTGIVWNMDDDRMERAALISMLPTLGKCDSVGSLAATAATGFVIDKVLSSLGLPEVVQVDVLNPTTADFAGKKEIEMDVVQVDVLNPTTADFAGKKEIEMDRAASSLAERRKTQLTVRVTYMFQMRIPFANWIIWESWWASRVGANLRRWDDAGQVNPLPLWDYFRTPDTSSCPYDGLNASTLRKLAVAAKAGFYIMPMVTTHTMRMQSNPFLHKPGDSSKVWAYDASKSPCN
ncbi:MAG: TadE/TadG family type IV pilus assembly protein [Myxococcales bacterium]|jgi:hypothetical protein